ncbi:unnamed protein product [Polarella glacialis]|uniref:Uncharacterized protein n=1 Tax=Polarella glacialis TaxID=89957 RepID=A0A813FL37_POLGL|nr:unnamed protein product [Polarella glacialis]
MCYFPVVDQNGRWLGGRGPSLILALFHRSEWSLAWRPRAVADPGIVVLCVGCVFRVCFVGVAAVVFVSLSLTAGLFCRVLFHVVSNAMRVSQIARSRIMSPEMGLSLVIFPGVISGRLKSFYCEVVFFLGCNGVV